MPKANKRDVSGPFGFGNKFGYAVGLGDCDTFERSQETARASVKARTRVIKTDIIVRLE